LSHEEAADLAADGLERVLAPTLLIVGGDDDAVIQMNEEAFKNYNAKKTPHYSRGNPSF